MRLFNTIRWTNRPALAGRARAVAICVGKQPHRSPGAAAAHGRSLERRFGEVPQSLRSYRCAVCGNWHLGRASPAAMSAPDATDLSHR